MTHTPPSPQSLSPQLLSLEIARYRAGGRRWLLSKLLQYHSQANASVLKRL